MDSGLRKRHKWMWLILAPVLFILVFLVLDTLRFPSSPKSFDMYSFQGTSIKEAENDKVKIVLSNSSNQYVLNVLVKQPLRATSSVVFEINGKGEKGRVLGQLEGEGNYAFAGKGNIKGIVVEDVIKKQQILKLEF